MSSLAEAVFLVLFPIGSFFLVAYKAVTWKRKH